MQLKPKKLVIPTDNPFAEDKLSRSQSADVLTQLVSTIREPFVLAIDSPWGTGKSTFINMWMAQLKAKGFPCLCFNAWDSDFTGDPLVSFIGEMRVGLDLSSKNTETPTVAEAYFSKGKQLLGTLARKSAPWAIKVLTQGALDLEGIKDSAIADLTESLAKEKIEQYEADKNTIVDFKAHLKKFVDHLSTQEGAQNKPLMFFIDELDRCRPTYAIDLLEKIKHLFNVEGIIFVLAIDKVQIGHSIGSIYGLNMDVDGYLRRFIDLDYRLPNPPRAEFCASLSNRFNLPALFKGRNDEAETLSEFLKAFSMLSEIFKLSLRTIEQCFAQLNIVFRTTPKNHRLYPNLLAFLIALKARNLPLYDAFAKGIPDIEAVLDFIKGLPGGNEYIDSFYGQEIEAFHALAKGPRFDSTAGATPYRLTLEKHGVDSPQGKRAHEILEIMTWLYRANAYAVLGSSIRRIELAEQFTAL